jgi:hypothetical protein
MNCSIIIRAYNEEKGDTSRDAGIRGYRCEARALRRIYPEVHFNLYDFLRLTITNIFSDLWHAAREHVL